MTVMAMGPQLTGAGGVARSQGLARLGSIPPPGPGARPRCGRRDPSPGHAGRGGQVAGQSTIPLSSPRAAASAPSPIPFPKDRRCGKSLQAVSAPRGHSCVPVSAGHPGSSHAQARPAGPVWPVVVSLSTPASSCPGPGHASEERAKGWPAVGSSGPGRWAVSAKGLANAQQVALGQHSLGGQAVSGSWSVERGLAQAEFSFQDSATFLIPLPT